jgi:hypothetical protein
MSWDESGPINLEVVVVVVVVVVEVGCLSIGCFKGAFTVGFD